MYFFSNYIINPLSSLLASLLVFINFLIVFIPIYFVIIFMSDTLKYSLPNNLVLYIFFGMYFFTLIYIVIDIVFSFTIRHIVKDCEEIKNLKDYEEIQLIFEETLEKFNLKEVKFLLSDSAEVNAFAVASFRKQYVIVTTGILNHIINTHDNQEDRRISLKGIIAHELSHLINWDFLPNLILISGANIALGVKYLSDIFINILVSLLRIIPIVGAVSSTAIIFIYNILTFSLNFTFNYILHPIYILFERYLGRLVEYRSDYLSTKALNWEPMYYGLFSLLSLNSSTYHSNFSTHPNTISRMLKVYGKEKSNYKINVNFFSKYFGLFIVLIIPFMLININILVPEYLNEYFNIVVNKFSNYQNIILNKYNYYNLISYVKEFFLNFKYSTDYILYVIGLIGTVISIIVLNYINNIRKIKSLNNVNFEVNTELDILLYYAIQNNDLKSFLNILKHGANFNTNLNNQSLFQFAEINNPKFLKNLERIKIQ